MLPTSGYFRDLPCPFLKLGLCERQHCHYRHDNPKSFPRGPSLAYSTSTTTPTPPVTSAQPLPVYVPTPVAQLKAKAAREDKPVNVKPSSSSLSSSTEADRGLKRLGDVPEYRPTPISELKKQIKEEGDDGDDGDSSDGDSDSAIAPASDLDCDFSEDDQQPEDPPSSKKRPAPVVQDNDSHTKKPRVAHQPDLKINRNVSRPARLSASQMLRHRLESVKSKNDQNGNGQKEAAQPQTAYQRKLAAATGSLSLPKSTAVSSTSSSSASSPSKKVKESPLKTKPGSAKKSTPVAKGSPQKQTSPAAGPKKRPTIVYEFGNKFPVKNRQMYLDKYVDEFLVFCEEDEAFTRAVETEKSVYDRCTSKAIYTNLSAVAIKRIREEGSHRSSGLIVLSKPPAPKSINTSSLLIKPPNIQSSKKTYSKSTPQTSPSKMIAGNKIVSHQDILNGPQRGSTFSFEKKLKLTEADLTDVELFKMLNKYVLSEQQLKEYGYPRPHPTRLGEAEIPNKSTVYYKNNKNRTCSRCRKSFTVDDNDMPKLETCVFHPGRSWNFMVNRSLEKKYSCCKNEVGAGGCESNKYHVIDGCVYPDYFIGFVRTLPKKPPSATEYYGIFGIDCEMCYTTIGLELTRVTVVNQHEHVVYESLVKPKNQILDYNSRFSGIKQGDLDSTTKTIEDVQNELLRLFNDKTILIGHSLDSDLKALKMIHETVIDTSQVFPHKKGLPYKRALRNLTAEILKSIIQNDVDGHDSQEDAAAAVRLMMWKVREDLKKLTR